LKRTTFAAQTLAICFIFAIPASATTTYTIVLDNSTSLLDGSFFTVGATYYSAFQLTGGDASDSSAFVGSFDIGGGSAIAPGIADPVSGTYIVGPNAGDAGGIFQTAGTLLLTVVPADSYSLYTQQFTAGSQFGFTVSLNGVFLGGTPDLFSFQLYDSSLSTLLYEQDLAILDSAPTSVPEPDSAGLFLVGLALVIAPCWRRRSTRA
jgi:hypothetical protein